MPGSRGEEFIFYTDNELAEECSPDTVLMARVFGRIAVALEKIAAQGSRNQTPAPVTDDADPFKED